MLINFLPAHQRKCSSQNLQCENDQSLVRQDRICHKALSKRVCTKYPTHYHSRLVYPKRQESSILVITLTRQKAFSLEKYTDKDIMTARNPGTAGIGSQPHGYFLEPLTMSRFTPESGGNLFPTTNSLFCVAGTLAYSRHSSIEPKTGQTLRKCMRPTPWI